MKNSATLFAVAALFAAFTASVSAQTSTFNDSSSANSFVTSADNWSNGLPTGGISGIININAGYEDKTLVGYDILHAAGTIFRAAGLAGLKLDGGTTWETNGESASFSTNVRGILIQGGSTFTLNNGTWNQENNRDVTVTGAGSKLTVNGGAFNAGRSIKVSDNAELTITGGVASTTGTFFEGGFITGTNTVNLNGGTTTGARLVFQRSGSTMNVGGTTVGSATFEDWGTGNGAGNTGDRADDRRIKINVLAGSEITFAMGGGARELDFDDDAAGDAGAPWAEALWNEGQLVYIDGASTISGTDVGGSTIVSWADATNSGVGFGTASSEYFTWSGSGSFGGSLVLADTGAGPPPSSESAVITSFAAVTGSPGVFQLTLTGGNEEDYVLRSSSDLSFAPGNLVENLVAGVPAAGTIGGTSDSVITTDTSGNATVRVTLSGSADYIRAEEAP